MVKKRYEHKITLGKDEEGKLIRKSFYSTKSKADARKKAERFRVEYELALLSVKEASPQKTHFKDWAYKCLEVYKKPYVKGNTYNGTYLHPVRVHLIPEFGELALEDIRPLHVQDYINRMSQKYKPETVKKDFTVLAFIMQHAAENGLCRSNPAAKSIQLPKIERADKIAYTQAQYDFVYAFAKNHPDGLSIMLMMETGITRSELLGLRWEDFDAEAGVLWLKQGLVSYRDADEGMWVMEASGLKNAYRRRKIPIVDTELLQQLRDKPRTINYLPHGRHKAFRVSPEYMFHSPSGRAFQPSNWTHRVFDPFMQELHDAHPEIPVLSAHELRHTRATIWIAQGIDPFMVARLLGHSDTKMLMKVYDHTSVDTLRSVLEKVQTA